MSLESAVFASESQMCKERYLDIVCDAGIFVAGSVFDKFGPSAASQITFNLGTSYQEKIFL